MNGNCNCKSGNKSDNLSTDEHIEHVCSCGHNHKGSEKINVGLNILDEKSGEIQTSGCACGGNGCGCSD